MNKINLGRVIVGGLVAGLVINASETVLNLFVLNTAMEDALRARNLPPIADEAIGGFIVLCFLLGLSLVWLYAAMRPRFGAGPKTAIIAAVEVWWLAFVFPQIGNVLLGVFSMNVTLIALCWGFAEVAVAALVGAWLYRE